MLDNGCNYLSMLGLKLNHVSKRGHWAWIAFATFLAATKRLYEWFSLSIRPSDRLSACMSHIFLYVSIIVSSWNLQELLPSTEVMSMQKVKVRGQRSRSQRLKIQLNRFRTVTPVGIHIWWWNWRRQAIIWTNAGIMLIGPLRTKFSEILIGIQAFSFKKMHLKMSSAIWRPFCHGLNVLIISLCIFCGTMAFYVSKCEPLDKILAMYEDSHISRDYHGISTRDHWQVMDCDCQCYGLGYCWLPQMITYSQWIGIWFCLWNMDLIWYHRPLWHSTNVLN